MKLRFIPLSVLSVALICSSTTTQPMSQETVNNYIPAPAQKALRVAVIAGGVAWGVYEVWSLCKARQARGESLFPSLQQIGKDAVKTDFISDEAHNRHLATFITNAYQIGLHNTATTAANIIIDENNARFTLECKMQRNFGFLAQDVSEAEATLNKNTNYSRFYKDTDLLQKARDLNLPETVMNSFVKLVERSIINRQIEDIISDPKLDEAYKKVAVIQLMQKRVN